MAVQAGAEACPQTSGPCHDSGEQDHRSSTDTDGKGDQDVRCDTVDEDGQSRDEVDLGNWWPSQTVQQLDGVCRLSTHRAQVKCAEIDLAKDLGVDAGVLEDEDGD